MPRTKTNRIELIRLRKRRELVVKGISLLTSKRDALMIEFKGAVKDVRQIREKLDSQMAEASQALIMARAAEPHHLLAAASLASQKEISFEMSMKNVWGVRIPSARFPDARRNPFERGSAPGPRSLYVDESAGLFEEVINTLATSALAEQRLLEIGGAIKKATRRVNALEGKVKPEMENDINIIQTRLEEMGREETFRLKRFKRLKERR
ncbi:MAG: V-type ATP synthase subunit D [Nitrospinae bacterium]|nr:V-type ATP synthase subunit D [Nitrospinota bacterium]